MHLSSLLPWLVVAGSVVGHPTSLVARASDDERRINDGQAVRSGIGETVGNIVNHPVVIFGAGALAAKSPDIYRWYKNRPPAWYRLAREYSQQTPEQRAADNHRLLRRIKFSKDEQASIDRCKSNLMDQYWNPDADYLDEISPDRKAELQRHWNQIVVECRMRAVVIKMEKYEVDQARKKQTQGASSSAPSDGNTNQFSINDMKLPKLNFAAVGPALNRAVSKVAAQPRLVKGM